MPEAVRTVHKIESTASLGRTVTSAEKQKKRVAAYARVSTDSDEQLSSYEAQVAFYSQHIKSNPEWEFVSVYTDAGISGTSTKKWEGFNQMVADALNGKIDLILTKSISRFARNTVDTLSTIRRLKEKGIEVYFEKENIYTLDAKGEVMITIMSSLAQEESRSISENITWGMRKGMEKGKIMLPYKNFLGYEKGEDGLPRIVESEAGTVREIYRRFLNGETVRSIAEYLTSRDIPTPKGRKVWCVSTIMSILTNEKYRGSAVLQKTYTADFLTKKVKKNNGEIPQYRIENSHPAIIDPETFELVQQEIKRRRPVRRQLHKNSVFCGKILCGDCGGFYGRKVWHSNSKYRKNIWRCNHKYDSKETGCATPNLTEEEIEKTFLMAFNRLIMEKTEHTARLGKLLAQLSDTKSLEQQLEAARAKHSRQMAELRRYMEENTRQVQDQEEYSHQFAEMDEACKTTEERIDSLQQQILAQLGDKEQIRRSIRELEKCRGVLNEFNPDLWNATVESVTIGRDKTFTFLFRDKTKVSTKLPEKKQE